MTQITVDIPDNLYRLLRKSPDEIAREMRLNSAIRWYQLGLISQEKAAELAGTSRWAYLEVLAAQKVDVFRVDVDSLKREFERE